MASSTGTLLSVNGSLRAEAKISEGSRASVVCIWGRGLELPAAGLKGKTGGHVEYGWPDIVHCGVEAAGVVKKPRVERMSALQENLSVGGIQAGLKRLPSQRTIDYVKEINQQIDQAVAPKYSHPGSRKKRKHRKRPPKQFGKRKR